MALENYRDLSSGGSDINAGFQFEFTCSRCQRRWKSPFKPYRVGQIAGLLTRFAFLIPGSQPYSRSSGNVADMGSRGAKQSALADALRQAENLYTVCDGCKKAVCSDCYDPRERCCLNCVQNEREAEQVEQRRGREAAASTLSCPNCRTPSSGGRFCGECGFDMASTHKSCPGCGTMISRQARFCTDCGHSF